MNESPERADPIIVFIIVVICAVILSWTINEALLATFGSTALATEIHTVCQGIDTDESGDMSYRWDVSWSFMVDDVEYFGSASNRLGTKSSVEYGNTVYYYPFAPGINSLYANENAGAGAVGKVLFALVIMSTIVPKKKKTEIKNVSFQHQLPEELHDTDEFDKFFPE